MVLSTLVLYYTTETLLRNLHAKNIERENVSRYKLHLEINVGTYNYSRTRKQFSLLCKKNKNIFHILVKL